MKKTKLISSTGLIGLALLLLVVNLLAGLMFKSTRLDLTANQLYTLSDGTRSILSKIEEPVTLRFYFSEKLFTGLPSIMTYGQRVRDLLEEYVSLSGGELKVIVSDPEPFSETEDQAVQYGLQGVPVDASGSQAYFGVVGTNATDDEEVIPFLQPDKEDSLEYDITRMVYKLANPKKRIVGLITDLPMEGAPSNPFMGSGGSQRWYILNQLEQNYDVKQMESDVETIPEDIDVLVVAHPKNFSDKTQYAIDQFVLKGGRLIVFTDPFSEVDVPPSDPQNPMAAMQAPRNSSLDNLFSSWGIELVKNKVVGDRLNAQRVQAQMGRRVQAVDYVAWLSLSKDNFNESDFVTRDLERLGMATSGYLKKVEGSEMTVSPLIETSAEAATFDSMQFQFGANPSNLLRNYTPGGEKLMLAARVSGKAKTSFPDGIEGVDSAAQIKESAEDINVIVVADTDMLEDKHWVRLQNFFGSRIALPLANNDVFLLNAIENLSGSNDLISLRSRAKSARPFTKVQELKREAEQRFRDKEKSLQDKLQQTERKLAELQQQREGGQSMILTAEQREEIAQFRDQQVQTRKELRNVQHELLKSVENLGTTLKVINIAGMPLVIILLAIFMAVRRTRLLRQDLV